MTAGVLSGAMSKRDYDRVCWAAQPCLHALLSRSPLRYLDFERESVRSPVRDAELYEAEQPVLPSRSGSQSP